AEDGIRVKLVTGVQTYALPILPAMQRFLVGVWPTIELFPQFMSMNLKKAGYGDSAGEDMARRYLIHNIRVEQKHADHWSEWAKRSEERRVGKEGRDGEARGGEK